MPFWTFNVCYISAWLFTIMRFPCLLQSQKMVVDCTLVIKSKVKPFSRPHQTRKDERMVDPVFCKVDTESCSLFISSCDVCTSCLQISITSSTQASHNHSKLVKLLSLSATPLRNCIIWASITKRKHWLQPQMLKLDLFLLHLGNPMTKLLKKLIWMPPPPLHHANIQINHKWNTTNYAMM